MSSQQYPVSHQEAYQALVHLLEQGDEAQSCYSAKAIADAQYHEALPQLNQCLYHPDADVVIDASKALGELQQGDIESLIDVAKNHPDGDARQAALIALSQQSCLNQASHPETIKIISLFEYMAQGRLENDNWGISSDWDEWWDLQLLAVTLLSQVASTKAQPLFKQLLQSDPEPELEMALYNALAQLDLDYCQTLLETPLSLTQSRKIIRAISLNLSPEASIILFKQMTQSHDEEIKIMAIKALAKRSQLEYQWDLANQLCDSSSRVQACALEALTQLAVLPDISLSNLESFAQREQTSNLTSLLALIDQHPDTPSPHFLDWLSRLLGQTSLALAALDKVSLDKERAAAQIIAHSVPLDLSLEDPNNAQLNEHYQIAFERVLALAKETKTPIEMRIQLIHLLGEFKHKASSLINEYRFLLDPKHHDVMIRQACFESLQSFSKEPAYQALIMGLVLDAKDDGYRIDAQSIQPKKPRSSDAKHSVQQADENIQISSTLAAIAQGNQATSLAPEMSHEVKISNMVADLEQEFEEYGNLVTGHFHAAHKLDLNRRKIAKRPQISNQILAIRCLIQCPYEFSAPLLIEALIGATAELQVELFNSMARVAEQQGSGLLKNAFGALANVMYQGTSLSKQAATRLLGQLRSRQSLTLILLGTEDEDEHVRICSLMALKHHMDVKKSTLLPLLEIQRSLRTCLLDKAGGVRKLALPLLARLEQEEDVINLLECAIHDEESHSIAAKSLLFAKDKSLSLLAQKLPHLENQPQYLAIQLTGQLLAHSR